MKPAINGIKVSASWMTLCVTGCMSATSVKRRVIRGWIALPNLRLDFVSESFSLSLSTLSGFLSLLPLKIRWGLPKNDWAFWGVSTTSPRRMVNGTPHSWACHCTGSLYWWIIQSHLYICTQLLYHFLQASPFPYWTHWRNSQFCYSLHVNFYQAWLCQLLPFRHSQATGAVFPQRQNSSE